MKGLTGLVFFAGTMLLNTTTMAGNFDGSKQLVCANQQVNECVKGERCKMVAPMRVNLPNLFNVDVENKVITGKHDRGLDASTPVEHVEHLDGKLMLQGADDGLPDVRDGMVWSMAIDETSGRMSLTASGDGFAIVAFGACMVR
jgi:hypothetical protein